MSIALEVKNVSFSYDYFDGEEDKDTAPEERSYALKNVSLAIEAGSFVAVLGHNGSGKSTLARVMSLINSPDEGCVYIGGKNMSADGVTEDDINLARRDIGIVFQNPDNQIVATVVEEDVAFGVENLGLPSDEIRRRVDSALETVGMTKYARHAPDKLSGGQKQRVAIAGVIAMKRKIIIFDESTAMLDPMGRRDVLKTVEYLNREEGVTVILITHYMSEAVLADRVVVLKEGEIFMDGTPREVFGDPEKLWSTGLDVPQTTELLWHLHKSGLPLRWDIFTADGCADETVRAMKLCGMPIAEDKENSDAISGAGLFATVPSSRNRQNVGDIAEDACELSFKDISFTYSPGSPYENRALNGIDLTLKGGMTGIIGHTGSGKSTLVQLANGLLKPSGGAVYLNGNDIWREPKKLRDVRFTVGLVMQYPEYQLFDNTVYDDIAFGPKNMKLSADEIKGRVYEAAEFVGLDVSLMDKSPFELSGGQKRRVALAGVLSMRPRVLILDEPAAGLDPGGRREILGEVREYMKKTGATVILVSHSMEDMAMYCDRILVMSLGKLVMDGDPGSVFSRYNELISRGLDVPEITRTAAALADRGIDIGEDVYTVGTALERLRLFAGRHI